MRLEIAHKAGVDPFEVSIGLLVQYAPQYAYEGRDPVKIFVERGRKLGFIRPSRRTRIRAPGIPVEAILPRATRTGANSHTAIRQSQMFQTYRQLTKSELVGTDGFKPDRGLARPSTGRESKSHKLSDAKDPPQEKTRENLRRRPPDEDPRQCRNPGDFQSAIDTIWSAAPL